MKTQIYMVDVGVCLRPDNNEYEMYKYIDGLDYSLYDENLAFFTDKEKAIQFVSDYIKDGVVNTYGMVVDRGIWYLDHEELREIEEHGYADDIWENIWENPKKEDILWFSIKII